MESKDKKTMNFNERPILVFWESTRACLLACKHCRAEAIDKPLPDELSTKEALLFIESLIVFGRPYPVLIMTGGDVLMRTDIFDLVGRARALGIPVGMAPSVTSHLTDDNIAKMIEIGVKVVSVSLDGSTAATHERIRGISGHFNETVNALQRLVAAGIEVQVNTTVMKDNVAELPGIVQLLKETGVSIWEVFFLIQVGRGRDTVEICAEDCEDVAHILFEASTYNLTVRTVEAPFFRRVVAWRKTFADDPKVSSSQIAEVFRLGSLYRSLSQELRERMGAPSSISKAYTRGTRDGKGIIFVAHNGTVFPAGFLPMPLGNIREDDLVSIYRDHPVLTDIRATRFTGRCGVCDYRDTCGGSRSRSYAKTGDSLGEDPACIYQPSETVRHLN